MLYICTIPPTYVNVISYVANMYQRKLKRKTFLKRNIYGQISVSQLGPILRTLQNAVTSAEHFCYSCDNEEKETTVIQGIQVRDDSECPTQDSFPNRIK